jgi:FKBP-type peptidyl-prolyl cis-trans isomerase 2
MVNVKKGDYVEVEFSGYTDGELFDTNIAKDLKKLDPEGKQEAKPLEVIVGEGMVIPGFDSGLEGAEVGKEKKVEIVAKEGYGERHASLVRVIPMKIFTEQEIRPVPGMSLMLQQGMMKILSVGGARVTADMNHPLAGKDLTFTFVVKRKITDEKQKVELVLKMLFRQVPEHVVSNDKVVVKGPKALEQFVGAFGEKFKALVGKELDFEVKNLESSAPGAPSDFEEVKEKKKDVKPSP